ncbi:hypothetical protein [Pseudonocardia sp. HH130629-09]|uniref:hypothetical protein n=1 Tax=Pseudonocardia sp. HH130629-09 TaxID=1641402 RepID=UPI0011AEBAE2|nr:hypothetical protein [Pseudonocardia sp. HH130629-09]
MSAVSSGQPSEQSSGQPSGQPPDRPSRATPAVAGAAAVLLVAQQVPGLVLRHGTAVPVLPVGLWRAWLPLILAGLALLSVSTLWERRLPGAAATTGRVAGLLLALGPATLLAYRGRLVDPLAVYTLGIDPSERAWPVVDLVLGTLLALTLVVCLLRTGAAGRSTARARAARPR